MDSKAECDQLNLTHETKTKNASAPQLQCRYKAQPTLSAPRLTGALVFIQTGQFVADDKVATTLSLSIDTSFVYLVNGELLCRTYFRRFDDFFVHVQDKHLGYQEARTLLDLLN